MKAMLGAALLALLAVGQASAQSDVDILNFALNLEYLEASFYHCVIKGTGLPYFLRGTGPTPVTPCPGKALLSPEAFKIASAILNDELAHVKFLRSALGSAAVDAPLLNINSSFVAAANAAFNNSDLQPGFNPYDSDEAFYLGAFIFEDVGVTAYLGAAPLIQNKDYLRAAAGIHAVEAYHAGIIRAKLIKLKDRVVFPYGVSVGTVVNAISSLRSFVDGVEGRSDQGISFNGTVNYIPTDSNGLAIPRLPANVLPIVYLGASPSAASFYPSGMNGNIK